MKHIFMTCRSSVLFPLTSLSDKPLACLALLTLLGAVSPAGHPAVVAVGDSVRRGWQAHGLDQRAEGGRPGLLQPQQRDVIVKRVRVVILVHHDPLDIRHVFGSPLRQHAEVGAPVTGIRQSGGATVKVNGTEGVVGYTAFN